MDEFESIGWVAEYRWAPPTWAKDARFPKFTKWELTFNHKIYRSEEAARHAVSQHSLSFNDVEVRYREVLAKKQD